MVHLASFIMVNGLGLDHQKIKPIKMRLQMIGTEKKRNFKKKMDAFSLG